MKSHFMVGACRKRMCLGHLPVHARKAGSAALARGLELNAVGICKFKVVRRS